jgi:uncharacterized protein (TIGR02466 family)
MSALKLIDVTPFEPMIIKVHFDGFDWKELKPICDDMINKTPENVVLEDNGKSSIYNHQNQPHLNQAFRKFYEWLSPIMLHVLTNEWGFVKEYEYIIGNSWVNVHGNAGLTKEHNHGPAAMVSTAYLQMPKDSGYIQFKDPLEYEKSFQHHQSADDWEWKTIPAITGDVLLFPGWVRHRTEPSKTNEERWVLTSNVLAMNRPVINKNNNTAGNIII